MTFDHPSWLLGLWLLVPLALLLARAERRRRDDALRFASPSMVARLLPPLGGARPWLRSAALLSALGFFVVAAAGPRFGVTFEPVKERGADLMVVLDVSRSMLSEDVAPNRLERAKSDVRDLVARVVGHRLGLVVFAGKAVLACPLTTDRGFFQDALARVDPRSAPRGGTAIGDAIRVGMDSMPRRNDRDQALLLITDGEDQDSYPLEAAKLASERGVKIFTVGLGDPAEGARVPVATEGGRTFLKHDGQEVWSKMHEGLLTDLATTTGGAYVPARTSAYDLGVVYTEHLASLSVGEIRSEKRKRLTPRFQLFLAIGLGLALAQRLIGAARRRPQLAASIGVLAPVFALAFAGEARAGDAPDEVRQGIALLKEGKAEEALARFDAAAAIEPQNLVIAFDRALAKEAKDDRDGARADYLLVAAGKDGELAQKALFNLGSLAAKRAELALGEKPEDAADDVREQVRGHVEEAVRHLRACLAADPEHANARKNLELLRVWLKHMEDVWARKDREKERAEKDVLEFLDWLHVREGAIRAGARELARAPDSPMRRTAVDALAREQRELQDEIPHLQEKIAQSFQQAMQGSTPQPGQDPAQLEQRVGEILQAADFARTAMKASEDALAEDKGKGPRFADADAKGREAQAVFDGLWIVLGGFEPVVGRSVQLAQQAVDATKPFVASTDDPAATPPKPSAEPEGSLVNRELDERVTAHAGVLPQIAEAMKQQIAAAPPAPDPAVSPTPPDPNAPPDPDVPAQPDPAALLPALDKAIENGPLASELAAGAKTKLEQDDAAGALKDEEEALRLLKEIADLLPKPPEQDEKQEDKQDEKKDEPQDSEPKPEDEKKDPKDDETKDEKEDEPKEGDKGDSKPPPKMTPEQAQALIRKAMEHAKKKAEEQKEAEEAVLVPGRVDRDW